MLEMHIFVTGTVQGVGFRAAVKRHALLHGIKGFVRNLSDGRVEICAQGHAGQIRDFIQTIRLKPGAGAVSNIEQAIKPMHTPLPAFEIR